MTTLLRVYLTLFCAVMLISTGCSPNPQKSTGSDKKSDVPTPEIKMETVGENDPIANPKAIKGGSFTTWGSSFPKSLNYWLDPHSFNGDVMGFLFEPLVGLHSTKNEPVGFLADRWSISDDKMTFTFHIHPQAQWSDGKPVTAEDVQFYYDVIMNPKNLTPVFRVQLKKLERPEVVDEKTIKVRAKEVHWQNFWEAAGLMAFPRHIWKDKDFNQINFEFPVVSGPYQISELKKERSLTLERRKDWWGYVKKYNQHKYNFDFIRFKFMEDRNKALEAFKKGDFDSYAIYTASIWAETVNLDQVKKGWMARQQIYNKEPLGFQGFAINLRRPLLQDQRVREALCLLLNRELMNEKLMYRQYFLLNSIYPDIYPDNKNPNAPLRGYEPQKARSLLEQAGWKVDSKGVLQKGGKPFQLVLPTSSTDLRHYNVYLEDLKKVGIQASIDQLSQSSLTKKIDQKEFDLYWSAWGGGRLRDPEPMWHSSTANEVASYNFPGVQDPEIDQLIETQKSEMDLNRRNEILKKIDTKLSQIIPYIYLWIPDYHRMLYWNKFGTPTHVFDKFGDESSALVYWWIDAEKQKALESAMKENRPGDIPPSTVRYTE